MEITKNYSFKNGYEQLRSCDQKPFRETLTKRLGMTTSAGFYGRMRGDVEPKASEVRIIEETFAEFGVTENVWG